MRIHHIAIWTFRLEEMKKFYIRYFKGTKLRNVIRNTYCNRIRNMVAYAVICIFCFGIVFINYFLFQIRLFIDNFNGNI